MQTMICTAPPQAGQVSMSMPKTPFQTLRPAHRGASFGRCRLLPIRCRGSLTALAPLRRCHQGAILTVRRKEPVKARQVDPRPEHQRR